MMRIVPVFWTKLCRTPAMKTRDAEANCIFLLRFTSKLNKSNSSKMTT